MPVEANDKVVKVCLHPLIQILVSNFYPEIIVNKVWEKLFLKALLNYRFSFCSNSHKPLYSYNNNKNLDKMLKVYVNCQQMSL